MAKTEVVSSPTGLPRPAAERGTQGSTILRRVLTPRIDLEAFADLPFPVATRDELRRKGMLRADAMGRTRCVVWNEGDPRGFADAWKAGLAEVAKGVRDSRTVRSAWERYGVAAPEFPQVDITVSDGELRRRIREVRTNEWFQSATAPFIGAPRTP